MRKGLIKQDECYTPKWFLKYFGDFEFINRYKEKYNIISVKPLKNSIKVEYEKR